MQYEKMLQLAAQSSYFSSSVAALPDMKSTDLQEAARAFERSRKVIEKALHRGHLKGYRKQNGLMVYGLTLRGANHLRGLGIEAAATVKAAYDAQHVYHRLVADAFSLALRLHFSKPLQDAGLSAVSWLERDCLRRAKTFTMHFQKVPDACFSVEKNLCWIEVDTARKKATDMARLIKFIKFGMCLNEADLAVCDLGNPQVLLWVCTPAAVRDAANHIQQSLPIKNGFKEISKGIWKVTVDSGSIERDVILCSFDFKSVSDIHQRIFKHYTPALAACCPVQL